eukprot:scaffold18229_cov66-Phaeocystis_antarctica.AAC.1
MNRPATNLGQRRPSGGEPFVDETVRRDTVRQDATREDLKVSCSGPWSGTRVPDTGLGEAAGLERCVSLLLQLLLLVVVVDVERGAGRRRLADG